MRTRAEFLQATAPLDLSHTDRAVALLWYYRVSQQFEERTASELTADLHDEGFPRPNVTRLHQDLTRSDCTIRGHRPRSFQIDIRRLADLDARYLELARARVVEVTDAIIPAALVANTRLYLQQIVHQMNGSYDSGFYDGCAVLCRRLMESLIVEVYVSRNRHQEIQANRAFLPLDRLIAHIVGDNTIPLNRNTPRTMTDTKQLGDTAAHDRTYVTQQQDIDDIKARYRRMIQELLGLAGVGR